MLETREEGASWLVDGAPSLSGQSNPAKWMKRAQSTEEQGSLVGFSFSESNDHRLSTPLHFVYERVYSFRTFLPRPAPVLHLCH